MTLLISAADGITCEHPHHSRLNSMMENATQKTSANSYAPARNGNTTGMLNAESRKLKKTVKIFLGEDRGMINVFGTSGIR